MGGGRAIAEPFMFLPVVGRGDCWLLVAREALEVTEPASSFGALLPLRLKRPILTRAYGSVIGWVVEASGAKVDLGKKSTSIQLAEQPLLSVKVDPLS